MNAELQMLPGYRVCEYMLVLQPHEELSKKILQQKKDFATKFETPAAFAPPKIILASFTQLQLMEDRIFNRLKMVAMAMPAFKVELKDYGSFPSHSVFIQVKSTMAIQLLIKNLKPAQRLLKTSEHKPHFMNAFNINIASKLLPGQYEKSWKEYSQKQFTGRFIANSMLLLKRFEGTKAYKPVQAFEFLNMPVVTTQGQLF